jgi:hypothetical protein
MDCPCCKNGTKLKRVKDSNPPVYYCPKGHIFTVKAPGSINNPVLVPVPYVDANKTCQGDEFPLPDDDDEEAE